jgi:hypothetical protein
LNPTDEQADMAGPVTAQPDLAQIAASLQSKVPGLAAALRRGDVLEAIVKAIQPAASGQLPVATLDIDGVPLNLQLPQVVPLGSIIKLRVEQTGQPLRLSLLPTQQPAIQPSVNPPAPSVVRSLSPQAQAALAPISSNPAASAAVPSGAMPSAPTPLPGATVQAPMASIAPVGPPGHASPHIPQPATPPIPAANPTIRTQTAATSQASSAPVARATPTMQVTVALTTNPVPQARPQAVEARIVPTLTPGRFLVAVPGLSQTVNLPSGTQIPPGQVPAVLDTSRAQLTLSLPITGSTTQTPSSAAFAAPAAAAAQPVSAMGMLPLAAPTSPVAPTTTRAPADAMLRLTQAVRLALPVLAQLPDPIRRAVTQLAARTISVDGAGVSATQLRNALQTSGIFLESSLLAGKGAVQGDMKSVLASLGRTAPAGGELIETVDGVATIVRRPSGIAEAPQQRPGAMPVSDEQLAALVRDLTDSGRDALERVRVHQASSIPDEIARQSGAAEWRLELPFVLFGTPITVPLRITRDGRKSGGGEQAQRWSASFSVSLGEDDGALGAHVGLVGKQVSCVLWADDPDIADELQAGLEDIGTSLGAAGLLVGGIAVRRMAAREGTE